MKHLLTPVLIAACLLSACTGMEPVRVYNSYDVIALQNKADKRLYMTGSRIPLNENGAQVMDNRSDIRDVVQDSHQQNMERH